MDASESRDVATLPDGDRTILDIPRQFLTPVSLELPEGVSLEAWGGLLPRIEQISNGTNWWLGDILLYGENAYGELYSQYLPDDLATATAYKTARWVASRIAPERRRPELSWSLHREVAPCESVEQDLLLDLAQAEGLSVRALRKVIADRKGSGTKERKTANLQGALAISSNRVSRPWRREDHDALAEALGLDAELPIPYTLAEEEDGIEVEEEI